MKVSFITTVLNEEYTVGAFLHSLFSQTKKPDEIVIVDGGSSDGTVAEVQSSRLRQGFGGQAKFKIIEKRGNRSVGRNEAIKNATGDVILCSDAGCVLDKRWIKEIIKPFKDNKIDVVAGYYKGRATTIFQKCLIPYVLVMPDRVNPDTFLPATRSMAFRKSIWEKVGGFPEEFTHNEDYVFARRLKKAKAKIVFQKEAIVNWIPRKNLLEAFIMFFRFSLGDAESGIFRLKVLLVFIRYFVGLVLFISLMFYKSYFLLYTFYFILFGYFIWSVIKNYKYVKRWKAIFVLPALQVIADFAVLIGTIKGLTQQINLEEKRNF